MTFLEVLHGAEVLAQQGNPSISGIEYDSRHMKAKNCPEADQYIKHSYRAGWKL